MRFPLILSIIFVAFATPFIPSSHLLAVEAVAATPQKTAQAKKTTPAPAKQTAPKKATPKKAAAPTSQQIKKQQDAVQKEVADTRRAIKENDANIQKGLNDLKNIQLDINSAQQRVKTLGNELSSINHNISKLQSQISAGEKELASMRAEYLKAVKKMRLAKKQNSDLAFIFSSKNFNQALRRMRYLREFSAWRDKQTKLINARVATLKKDADLLAQNQKAKNVTMRQQQQVSQQLSADYSRKDAIVADLRRNGDALNAHLAQKQAEANALKSQVANLIAQEEAARQAAAEKQRRQQEEKRAAQQRAEEQRRIEAQEREKARQLLAQQQQQQQQQQKAAPAKPTTPAKQQPAKPSTPPKQQPAKPSTPAKQQQAKQPAKQPAKPVTTPASPQKQNNVDYASARKRAPRSDNNKQSPAPQPTPKTPVVATVESAKSITPTVSGGSFESMRGKLPRPVGGAFRVKSPFGRHAMPGLPGVTYDNPGIDIETSAGAQARAVFAGKVSGVYKVPGFGTVVIISHGNYYTVYGNLAAASVGKGDSIKQGQAVGSVNKDADSSAHGELHFELWKNRDKLNPMDWIH